MQVGEVAASAAGDQDLFPNTVGQLQHGNAASALAGFHGAHQPGCAAAENDYVKFLRHYRDCETTPILSNALRYSTTTSKGTGPYSAETASRICCALRFPSAKFRVS